MSDLKFKVIFNGKIKDGYSKEKLGKSLCRFLKIDPKNYEKLFDGRNYALKKQLSEEQAKQIKKKLLSIGIISSIAVEQAKVDTNAEIKTSKKNVVESKFWQERFDILDSLPKTNSILSLSKTKEFKALDNKSSRKITFNLLAFFFGTFYYFFKGMWEKGIVIAFLSVTYAFMLSIVEEALEIQFYSAIYWAVPASITAVTATFDYYKKVSENQRIWPALKILNNKATLVSMATISILTSILPTLDISPINYNNSINSVKNGYLDYNKATTVGHAFDNWSSCKKKNWSEFTTKNKINIVEFKCITDFGNVVEKDLWGKDKVYIEKAIIFQFTLNHDGSFQINSIDYSNTPLDGEKTEFSATSFFDLKGWLYIVYSNSDI